MHCYRTEWGRIIDWFYGNNFASNVLENYIQKQNSLTIGQYNIKVFDTIYIFLDIYYKLNVLLNMVVVYELNTNTF